MQDENVTPEVSEQVSEAAEAHEDTAQEQGKAPWGGEGNQPEGTGHAPPNTGAGDSAESEIPVGVDAIQPVESAGNEGGSAPVDLANLDTGDDEPAGEAEAVDVSAAVEAPADADAAEGADADAGGDDAAEATAEAPDAAEAEATAEAPDAAEAEATAEPPDAAEAEATAEPAGDDEAEASAEPAGDDDEGEAVGDPDKFSGGGDIAVAGAGDQSAAEAAGEVPTTFRTPPGIPAGLDPGTPADRDKPV